MGHSDSESFPSCTNWIKNGQDYSPKVLYLFFFLEGAKRTSSFLKTFGISFVFHRMLANMFEFPDLKKHRLGLHAYSHSVYNLTKMI